jgi:hypothetical protein
MTLGRGTPWGLALLILIASGERAGAQAPPAPAAPLPVAGPPAPPTIPFLERRVPDELASEGVLLSRYDLALKVEQLRGKWRVSLIDLTGGDVAASSRIDALPTDREAAVAIVTQIAGELAAQLLGRTPAPRPPVAPGGAAAGAPMPASTHAPTRGPTPAPTPGLTPAPAPAPRTVQLPAPAPPPTRAAPAPTRAAPPRPARPPVTSQLPPDLENVQPVSEQELQYRRVAIRLALRDDSIALGDDLTPGAARLTKRWSLVQGDQPIEPERFYDMVGRPELAASYRRRILASEVGIGVTSIGAAVSLGFVFNYTRGVGPHQFETSSPGFWSWMALAASTVGLGASVYLHGHAHPVGDAELEQLANGYNRRLRAHLDLSAREPVLRDVRIAPFVSPAGDSGGLSLAAKF